MGFYPEPWPVWLIQASLILSARGLSTCRFEPPSPPSTSPTAATDRACLGGGRLNAALKHLPRSVQTELSSNCLGRRSSVLGPRSSGPTFPLYSTGWRDPKTHAVGSMWRLFKGAPSATAFTVLKYCNKLKQERRARDCLPQSSDPWTADPAPWATLAGCHSAGNRRLGYSLPPSRRSPQRTIPRSTLRLSICTFCIL